MFDVTGGSIAHSCTLGARGSFATVTTNLAELLSRPGARIDEVRRWLDDREVADTVQSLRTLDRAGQRRMYTLASLSAPMGLEHLVASHRAARSEVRHIGRNTLPVPAAFRGFEKRFCKPEDGSPRLFGYNEGASVRWFGPGYFVASAVRSDPVWAARGDIVVDYFQVPDGPVAETWPAVIPNTQGLQRWVFHGTRDFLRGVSSRVSIGAAYKGERALDHYFVLCRDD